jgi:CubicO group peptidase (beta-lactamase class C family)
MLSGQVEPDYADVASSLIRLLPRDAHAGAAVCVYHRGRPVVDIWGGQVDAAGSLWREDTTAPSFSTGKGVLATLIHILVDQGLADYDDPIARYWAGFGSRGKDRITIRQALCHEAGLYRITDLIASPREMLDWEHMLARLADAEPAHEPGTGHGYHALTYGWLIGGLIEAISGRSCTVAPSWSTASRRRQPSGRSGRTTCCSGRSGRSAASALSWPSSMPP